MIEAGAYPSPLNYYNFPKSVCTSVNEVSSEEGGRGGGRHAMGADNILLLLLLLPMPHSSSSILSACPVSSWLFSSLFCRHFVIR
jgi:hypothetical protein